MKECIILAGGLGKRLKPKIKVSKPLIKLNGTTLIDRQIKWLNKNGFDRIIIPSKIFNFTKLPVVWVQERKKLGTGGAVKLALQEVKGKRVYVMNCDDIVFYDPKMLWKEAHLGASILVTKLRSPYGIIDLDSAGNVLRFREKPELPYNISLGHYCFKTSVIKKYFPDKGDLELNLLQRLADKQILRALEYNEKWLTVNTLKQLEEAKRYLKNETNKFSIY